MSSCPYYWYAVSCGNGFSESLRSNDGVFCLNRCSRYGKVLLGKLKNAYCYVSYSPQGERLLICWSNNIPLFDDYARAILSINSKLWLRYLSCKAAFTFPMIWKLLLHHIISSVAKCTWNCCRYSCFWIRWKVSGLGLTRKWQRSLRLLQGICITNEALPTCAPSQ